MSLSDYWIGDHVMVISKNLKGQFEGIDKAGRALVRVSGSLLLIAEDDLEAWAEAEEEVSVVLIEPIGEMSFQPLKALNIIGHVIDLHYEKLAPEKQKNPHPHIIEFQLEKCREFIENAIRKRFTFIRIIHGRGQGKLKAAVESLLKNYPEINLVASTPDLGALEIWLK